LAHQYEAGDVKTEAKETQMITAEWVFGYHNVPEGEGNSYFTPEQALE